jgi:hypothetical protein
MTLIGFFRLITNFSGWFNLPCRLHFTGWLYFTGRLHFAGWFYFSRWFNLAWRLCI